MVNRPESGEMSGPISRLLSGMPSWRTAAAGLFVVGGVGSAAGYAPVPAIGLSLAIFVMWMAAWRPQWAGYIYLACTPLIVGLQRGLIIPIVRLNEVLLVVLVLGLLTGLVWRGISVASLAERIRPLDVAVVALAFFSSGTTLLWMYARNVDVTLDDLLYAATLWKYAVLYLLVRLSLRTPRDVLVAVMVIAIACIPVALIGTLQAVGVGVVLDFLAPYASEEFPETIANNRASSTIGAPIPFADVMVFALAISVAWLMYVRAQRVFVSTLVVLFGVGAFASGQVSGVLGLAVATVALGWVTGRLARSLLGLVVAAAVSLVLLQPVLAARLSPEQGGLTTAWTGQTGRLGNLSQFIWPQFGDGLNWLLGVRTSARIPAPEVWRDWIYIESGYTWLLWNGGVPLVLTFVVFGATAVRAALTSLRHDAAAFQVVGAAGLAGLSLLFVLMIVDTHLTMRGSADVLFPLLALCATGSERRASHVGRLVHDLSSDDETFVHVPAVGGQASS